MGVSALLSHVASVKHKNCVKNLAEAEVSKQMFLVVMG